jgi:hypothetical protein
MFPLCSALLPRLVLLLRGSARGYALLCLPWAACGRHAASARFNVGQSSFQIADSSIRIILIHPV